MFKDEIKKFVKKHEARIHNTEILQLLDKYDTFKKRLKRTKPSDLV